MNRIGFGHISLFCCIQKFDKTFYEGIFVVMTATAGIWLFLNPSHFDTEFRVDEPEGMAAYISIFSALTGPGHMACDTASEGMDLVGSLVSHGLMTTPEEFISL